MYQGANLLDPAERSARGEALHKEVTGLKPDTALTPYQQSWRDFIFAEVWSREGLDRRSRYLIAIAGAALGNGESNHLYGYVHGALKSKTFSVVELREAALHTAVYGGWSNGGHVDEAVSKAVKALKLVDEPCAPIRDQPWDQRTRGEIGGSEFMKVMTFSGGGGETPYLEAVRNFVFGEVWNRRALDERSRRWLTLVGVCESCAEIPIKSQIYAAMASGNCKPAEMQEFVLAYGIHAGWSKASVIQSAVFGMTRNFEMGLGWNG